MTIDGMSFVYVMFADTVYRFWRQASWVQDSVSNVFHLDNETGHVTVEIEGIYLIYAQVGNWSRDRQFQMSLELIVRDGAYSIMISLEVVLRNEALSS